MSTLRIGLCFDPHVLHDARHERSVRSLDVLLFPELIDGGYAALAAGQPPRALDDPFVHQFRAATRRSAVTCVAGSLHVSNPGHRATNTSLVFRRGRLLHRYDKIHLFKPAGDHRYFVRGDTATTFRFRPGSRRITAGVVICYDLRFPELMRALALDGMQMLFVPARWPLARDEAWCTLLKARAMENQVFVVGCNASGDEGGFSYAFNPMGKLLFTNKNNRPSLVESFEIDLSDLSEARLLHNNLKDAVYLRAEFGR